MMRDMMKIRSGRRWGILAVAMGVLMAGAIAPARAAQPDDVALSKALGQPFYSGAILPTPQEAEYGDQAVVLLDGPNGKARFEAMFVGQAPANKLAQELFETRVNKYRAKFPDAQWQPTDRTVPLVSGLISDPEVAKWLNAWGLERKAADLKEQGYLLEVRPQAIVLAGKDNEGVANAMASLIQLTRIEDGQLVAQQASVADWPVWTIRYMSEYWIPGRDIFDWMAQYKINGFASAYPFIHWDGVTDGVRRGMVSLKGYADQYDTLHYMALIHVGGRKPTPAFDPGDDQNIAGLQETIVDVVKTSGAEHIMLCMDDVAHSLEMPKEKERFDSQAESHGYLLGKVAPFMREQTPEVQLSFCPPFYQGMDHRKWRDDELKKLGVRYLRESRKWDPDVWMVWTGPVTESRRIDQGDINSYRFLMGKERPLMYWDNTWHYHQPLRNFHAKYMKGFAKESAGPHAHMHVNGAQPIGQFFSATAVDYYWNPDAYDDQRSWRQAVTQFMGPDAVPVAAKIYKLRGDDYYVFWSKKADLDKLHALLEELEAVSWTSEIPEYCWSVFDDVAKTQGKSGQYKH